jgi:hypothetical protein
MRHSCVNVHEDITGTIFQLVTPGLRKGSMGTFTAKKDEEDVGNYPCRKGGVMETFMSCFIVVSIL